MNYGLGVGVIMQVRLDERFRPLVACSYDMNCSLVQAGIGIAAWERGMNFGFYGEGRQIRV
jgi:hypothetical protein